LLVRTEFSVITAKGHSTPKKQQYYFNTEMQVCQTFESIFLNIFFFFTQKPTQNEFARVFTVI